MKFYSSGNSPCWRDINCAEQEVLEVECEKSHYSAGQLLSPTYDLMRACKVALDFPYALAMFFPKGRPIGVSDYLESSFIRDLKPVAYQRRVGIAAVDYDVFGGKLG